MNGWIKLYRKIMENPIVTKDADYLAIWVYLLLNATHDTYPALFRGKKILLKPGQLLTGRKAIASRLSISESKVGRVLETFKNEQQIEQQTSNKNRLISIVNWDFYQGVEQQSEQQLDNSWTATEQQVNNSRTTSEQQVNTNKNVKNNKNDKKDKNVKECKNERSKRESSQQIFERVICDFAISEPLREKIGEWLTYKTEKKQSYKETGLKSLLRQIERREQEFGSIAVIELIDDCMARNYQGIIWDKLQKDTGKQQNDWMDKWRDA